MRKPRPLQPGDLIVVPSPAGPVADGDSWSRLEDAIRARGYHVHIPPAARRVEGYLAGSDAERLGDLQQALDDPEVAAVIASRGGYGSMRLLRDLRLRGGRPPAFVGYSDMTALHLAMARHGWVTFHGPMAACDLGRGRPHGPSVRWLWGLLEGTARPPLALPVRSPLRLRAGRARGRLLGGNLALLASLVGTPFLPDLRGAVLLLEDVGEAPYRVDRMLTQLRLSGCLAGLSGLALGGFSFPGAGAAEEARRLEAIARLLADLAGDLGIPALGGLPCGHEKVNLALPLGVEVELDAGEGALVVVEDWLDRGKVKEPLLVGEGWTRRGSRSA